MEKQEAQEVLVNAMGSLFAEAEIEAGIAEAADISREEYNKIIENGLELPDCIKKYREINQKRKFYEEKLFKSELNDQLLQNAEVKPKDIPPSINESPIKAGSEVLEDIIKDCPHLKNQENSERHWITCSMPTFITWLVNNGFLDKDAKCANDAVSAEFIFNNFDSKCKKLETIEKAIREVRGTKKSKSG
jgi:hypothetical protein